MSAPIPAPDTPQGSSLAPSQQITQEAAAADAAVHTQARELATLLATPTTTSCQLVKGVVTAVASWTLSAQIGGDTSTTVDAIRYFDYYRPTVGDVVQIIKQDSDLVCIGSVNNATTVAGEAWVQPTLGTGFTHSADPIKYRLINDHGDNKIQLRGSATQSGTNTTVFTLPAGFRPSSNRVMLIPRDIAGGSNVVQLLINTTGTMVLSGVTTGLKDTNYLSGSPRTGLQSSAPNTSSTTPGNTGNTDVNHTHFSSDGPNPATPSSWTTQINTGFTLHNHSSAAHIHIGGDHQHYMDAVDHPLSIWLTGIEYFLA